MTIVLVVLAGVYVFTLRTGSSRRSSTFQARAAPSVRVSGTLPLTISRPFRSFFNLEPQSKLTEIKVVPLAAWQTNQGILPVWHLVASSNSVPIKLFFYGQRIRGLKPEVRARRPSRSSRASPIVSSQPPAPPKASTTLKSKLPNKIRTRLLCSAFRTSIFVPAKWHAAK